LKADILENTGYLYLVQGNADQAIDNYQNCLDIWEAVGNPFKIACIKNKLAKILRIQGDIHLALATLQQEIEIVMRNTDKILLGEYQFNIGLAYYELNRYDQTIDFLKLSLKNFKAVKNNRKIAQILYYLISIYIENNEFKKTNRLLEQLVKIDDQVSDVLINQWWLLGKAYVLRESTRYSELGRAEEIFNYIINGKEINHQVTVIALLNWCKMQLNYLQKIEDADLLNELKDNIKKLSKIADLQNSYVLHIETFLLQAQVAVLEYNLRQSEELIAQAKALIQLKEIPRLADVLVNFEEVLMTKLEIWEKLYQNNASLVDLLDLMPAERSLKEIAREQVTKQIFDQSEDPILFIIQDPGGTSMFSKKFLPNSEFDEQLISAFLFAINNFMQETFAGKGTIDRITYLDYTLLFIPKDPFLFLYAYRGNSYSSQQKLDLFVERFGNSTTIWKALMRYTETGLVPEIDILIILEELIDDIFNPFDKEQPELIEDESIEDMMSDLLDSKI
jgi:tetratricopeptide (TPR) repeat protein